jgi:hypothetical protein
MACPSPLRFWWRRLVVTVVVVSSVVVVGVTSISAYLADELVNVRPVVDTYPLRVIAIDVAGMTVTLSRGPHADEPGSFRMSWPAGEAKIGPVVAEDVNTVTRQVSSVSERLAIGQAVGVQPNPFTGNPRSALGLSFDNVIVSGPTGPLPAWFLSGYRKTWCF